jgi:hypothetical protein
MGALQADHMHPGISVAALTDVFKEEQNTNGKGLTYLVLSCTDKAFNTVTNTKVYQNAYEMRESLRKKYKADDHDDDLVGLVIILAWRFNPVITLYKHLALEVWKLAIN